MGNLTKAINILLDMEETNQELIIALAEEESLDLDMDYAKDMNKCIQEVLDLVSAETNRI